MVNTIDDLDDGICDSAHCSLREAINLANSKSGPDLIIFDPKVFPKSGKQAIFPTTELPHIRDDRTTITAGGAKVVIDGSKLTALGIQADGLVIHESSSSTLRGLQIRNYPGTAVVITANWGGKANNNRHPPT